MELSREVLKTRQKKKQTKRIRKKRHVFNASALFSFVILKVNSLDERRQAESHRQRISFFCKQIYVQIVRVKVLVSSLKCPFLFLRAGGSCYHVRIEGSFVAFQPWKWLMAAKLHVEAERGAWRAAEGGLAMGTCFEETGGAA